MIKLTTPRGAALVVTLLAGALSQAACTRSTELSTATIAPIVPVTTVPLSTPPSTVVPPTAPPTAAPTTALPTPPPTTVAPVTDAVTPASIPDLRASLEYQHPNLGPMTITIAYPERTDSTLINATVRATVDATGDVVFEATDEGSYYLYSFAGDEINLTITDPVDKRGHVFFEWDSGRYPGVSYLVPTATGFTANGSVDDFAAEVHYLAAVVDADGDGNYEIDQGFQVCTTSCADGYYYAHIWTWDGSDYTGSDVDPGPDGARFPGEPAE